VPAKAEVYSGRPLVALPGSRGHVQLNRGVKVTLWGNLPDVSGAAVLESMAELYPQEKLNADVLLHRGRIVFTNTNGAQPAYVRVRFADPKQKDQQMHFDITLLDKDSRVLVERISQVAEPFYDKPDHPNRVGPLVRLNVAVLDGSAGIQISELQYTLSAPPGAYTVSWSSRDGLGKDPQPGQSLREDFKDEPALLLPKEQEKFRPEIEKARNGMLRAVAELAKTLAGGKALDVALAETLQGNDSPARVLAIRCYGAINDTEDLMSRYEQDTVSLDVMLACRGTLLYWVA
jgi:hypothetical protein